MIIIININLLLLLNKCSSTKQVTKEITTKSGLKFIILKTGPGNPSKSGQEVAFLKNKIMQIKLIWIFLFLHLASRSFAQQKFEFDYGNNKEAGSYKRINGINLYSEIYGSGQPVVLLHGNGGSIRSSATRIEYLKKSFQVIAVDSRGHGKSTDDTKTPLTYVQMANDVATLLDSLKIDSAFVFGQSDGGILGLLLAIHYPQKVTKVATYGANLFPGKKAVFTEVDKMVRDTLKVTKDKRTRQLYSLLAYQPNISENEIKKIKCQVLIMCGDRDVIRLEHTIKIFYIIENSNLFVMPGATHFGANQKPDLFKFVLLDFFNSPFSTPSIVELLTGKK